MRYGNKSCQSKSCASEKRTQKIQDNLTFSNTVNYPNLLCECDIDSSLKLSVMLTHFSTFFQVGFYFIVIKFYWDSTDL